MSTKLHLEKYPSDIYSVKGDSYVIIFYSDQPARKPARTDLNYYIVHEDASAQISEKIQEFLVDRYNYPDDNTKNKKDLELSINSDKGTQDYHEYTFELGLDVAVSQEESHYIGLEVEKKLEKIKASIYSNNKKGYRIKDIYSRVSKYNGTTKQYCVLIGVTRQQQQQEE